jgi:ABC-type Fe3+/spermidine/putrescine transport system ATPase subunit
MGRIAGAKEGEGQIAMPKGPRGEKRPADVIGGAVKVMRIATGEETEELSPEQPVNLAAEQTGSPEEVSRRPRTAFVARFVGHKNVFPATVVQADGAGVTVSTPAGPLHAQRPVWSAFMPDLGASVAYVVDAFRVRTGHIEKNCVTGMLDMRSVSGGMEVLEVIVPALGIVRCERAVTEGDAPPDGAMRSWRSEDAYVLPPA